MQTREVTMDDLVREPKKIMTARRAAKLTLFAMAAFGIIASIMLGNLISTIAGFVIAFVVLIAVFVLYSPPAWQYGSTMPMPAGWIFVMFGPSAAVLFFSSFVFVGTPATVWVKPCYLEEYCETTVEKRFFLAVPFVNPPTPIPAEIQVKDYRTTYFTRNGEERPVKLRGCFMTDRSREMAAHFAVIYGKPSVSLEIRAEQILLNHVRTRMASGVPFSGRHAADQNLKADLREAGLIWNDELKVNLNSNPAEISYGFC